jgi:hypothetical protein
MRVDALRRWYAALAALWLNFCVLLVVGNLIAWAVLALESSSPAPLATTTVHKAFERIYAGMSPDDRATLIRESAIEYAYEPFTEYRERPLSGRFVNIDPDGFRRTKNQGPWPPDPRHCNIFVFGSSTAFGYGVADDHTIASYLQELLATDGLAKAPRVYNFGRGGYYSTQERILFEQLAVAGNVPDVAIFVDGPADMIFGYLDQPITAPGLRQCFSEAKVGRAPSYRSCLATLPVARLARVRDGDGPVAQPNAPPTDSPMRQLAHDDPAVAARVVERYVRNKRLIEGAARAMGVTPVFVWQPSPTYKYDLRYHVHSGSFGVHEYSRFGYPRVAEYVRTHEMGPDFVWCADIQEHLTELLYVDETHYSPAMSERVASCIVRSLREHGLVPCDTRRTPGE